MTVRQVAWTQVAFIVYTACVVRLEYDGVLSMSPPVEPGITVRSLVNDVLIGLAILSWMSICFVFPFVMLYALCRTPSPRPIVKTVLVEFILVFGHAMVISPWVH